MYDPNPIPSWSQEHNFKRFAHKLSFVFPYFKIAMHACAGRELGDWFFWDTPIMDEGIEERNR